MTRQITSVAQFLLVLAAAASSLVNAFLAPIPSRTTRAVVEPLSMNFFKDVMGKAFENDASLNKDITKGQYDGPNDGDDDDGGISIGRLINPQQQELTETQQRWRATQQKGGLGTSTSPAVLLTGSQWKLDLFLTGIPDRDPSNDLFGSKTNISSRDRKVGLMVPEEPTVSGIIVKLLDTGICQIESDSEFLDANALEGAWKVSDDGAMIRICMNVMGYQRTVQTKGSIQKIYWSEEDDTPVATSSAYSIPTGPMYGDASLASGKQVGTLQWNDGVLRVEQSSGLLGAGSKMVPCGRFAATRVE